MVNTFSLPTSMFNLEGTLIDFLADESQTSRAIALDVDNEPLVVQLSPSLWTRAQRHLRAGDCVRCVGWTQIDFQAGIITLKAEQIFRELMSCDRPLQQSANTAA